MLDNNTTNMSGTGSGGAGGFSVYGIPDHTGRQSAGATAPPNNGGAAHFQTSHSTGPPHPSYPFPLHGTNLTLDLSSTGDGGAGHFAGGPAVSNPVPTGRHLGRAPAHTSTGCAGLFPPFRPASSSSASTQPSHFQEAVAVAVARELRNCAPSPHLKIPDYKLKSFTGK